MSKSQEGSASPHGYIFPSGPRAAFSHSVERFRSLEDYCDPKRLFGSKDALARSAAEVSHYADPERLHSVPLSEFARRYAELPREKPLVLVCHHGRRSQHAAMLLEGAGFERLHNLHGGVAAWADAVEPTMKRY